MTIWIRVFFNNVLQWESLPSKFSVKRSWNRYADEPDQEHTPKDISKISLAKFLNKVKFYYVPTLRGPEVMSEFLMLLYDALSESHAETLIDSADKISALVSDLTTSMTAKIKSHFGFDSLVKMPKDLRDVFQQLEFNTSDNDSDVPLRRRGDGIQSSHIPLILDFISQTVPNLTIWGFEEPENSLEMARCFELAREFGLFAKSSQIFITTHSPAFYDLPTKDDISLGRWLVRKERFEEESDRQVTVTRRIDSLDEADTDVGLSALISERSRELFVKIEKLEEESEKLALRVAESEKPIIVVEGVHDAKIFESADLNDRFEIIAGTNADSVAVYINSLGKVHKSNLQPIIGIVDFDEAGETAVKRFTKYKKEQATGLYVINLERKVYIGTLTPSEEFLSVRSSLGVESKNIGMPIEYFFESDLVNQAIDAGVIKLKPILRKVPSSSMQFNLSDEYRKALDPKLAFYASKPDDESKEAFADWIIADDARLKKLTDYLEAVWKIVC